MIRLFEMCVCVCVCVCVCFAKCMYEFQDFMIIVLIGYIAICIM